METIQEFFCCDACQNRHFKRIYSFSLQFHRVNFAEELIYNRITDEEYQCTECKKIFTKDQIDKNLMQIKGDYKNKR